MTLKEKTERLKDHFRIHGNELNAPIINGILKDCVEALTEKLEREENRALTLEELSEFKSEPVYVVHKEGVISGWFIIMDVSFTQKSVNLRDIESHLYYDNFNFYRYNPKGVCKHG